MEIGALISLERFSWVGGKSRRYLLLLVDKVIGTDQPLLNRLNEPSASPSDATIVLGGIARTAIKLGSHEAAVSLPGYCLQLIVYFLLLLPKHGHESRRVGVCSCDVVGG